jgi:hypothetical protein
MPSPFPGMDPYLESPKLWPVFQHHLVGCLSSVLQPSLGDRYRLRVGNRTYVNQQVLLVSIVREEHSEEYLEIRQRPTGRMMALIDIVSPANRTTATGRKEYHAKRDEARQSGAHIVEIELVLQGHTCLDISTEGLPEFDYTVSVCRARQQDRYEIYTTTVQKRLPRFRLPLAADDRDLVVDLQSVFTRCYDQNFAGQIDYQKDPPTLLKDADYKWMQQMLKQQKLR